MSTVFCESVYDKYTAGLKRPQGVMLVYNVADYYYTLPEEKLKAAYANLQEAFSLQTPFKRTWFEFNLRALVPPPSERHYTDDAKNAKVAILTDYEPASLIEAHATLTWIMIQEMPEGPEISGQMVILCDKLTGKFVRIVQTAITGAFRERIKDVLENPRSDYLREYFAKQPDDDAEREKLVFRGFLNTILPVIVYALNFYHCRNVRLHEQKVGQKHIKNRQKVKGRLYFERYHLLEIEPMKRVLSEKGAAERLGLTRAFHICRGHFKEYTGENALFGKYTGRFWWSPHTRGDSKIGKVEKDYTL
jgi:hypothetical protein